MLLRYVVGLVLVSALLGQDGGGPPPEFVKAYQLTQAKQYSEALAILDGQIEAQQHLRNAYFSAGSIATMAEMHERAKGYFLKLAELEPNSGKVRMALIRSCQAMGDMAGRDEQRRILFEIRAMGSDPELKGQSHYLRDVFMVGDKRVMAMEHYELEGPRAVRYAFLVFAGGKEKPEYRISLGSYDATVAVWRETRKPKPKPGERVFHVDLYTASSQSLMGMFYPEPSYDEMRAKVKDIVAERNEK